MNLEELEIKNKKPKKKETQQNHEKIPKFMKNSRPTKKFKENLKKWKKIFC